MANKKVSQLTSKPSVLVTDLFPIADPSTGQLYKTTISDLGTAIGSGVSSVNGLVGAVVLDTDDIQELVSPTNKWFTDTRARAALSASSPLAYNSGTGVFSIPAATSSQNGYLTSTDWTTFNSKISGSGTSGRYARFTGSGTISDGFIETTGNITYVEGLGLSTLNGLEITGNFGGGSGGLKLKSYDETTGKAYMEFFNTSGNFRLGLEGSTGGGILPGSTAYATVLTTGLTAKNLEFGTNNTKRLTLDGTTGAATFTSTISATGATFTGALSGTSATFSSTITGSRNDNTTNVSVILQNSYINAGNLINFVHNSGGSTTNGYIGHGGDSTGNFVIINNAINALSLARATGAATFASTITATGATLTGALSGTSATFSGVSEVFKLNGGGTSTMYQTYNTTGGNYYIGISSSTGSGLLSGVSAYSMAFVTESSRDMVFGTNNVARFTIASTGAATFSSSVQTTNLFVGTTGTATTLNSIQSPYGILSGLIEANIAGNAYYNSGWKYYGNGPTGVFNIDTGGNFGFYTASSGVGGNNISLGNAKVTFTNAGNVGIGTTAPVGDGTALNLYGATYATLKMQNSTTGASITDGSEIVVDGSNWVFKNREAGDNIFYTNNSERMRITSGGNVGIGTTNPLAKLTVSNSQSEGFEFAPAISSNVNRILSYNRGTSVYNGFVLDGETLYFKTYDAERMRITSGGDVIINATTNTLGGKLAAILNDNGYAFSALKQGTFGAGILVRVDNTNSDYIRFFYSSSNTQTGSINTNGTTTTYNVTSDYRLKQDLKPINGLDIVNKIKVYDYEWKSDNTRMDGVLAHELQEILPYAVTGVKDGELMQQVDYSKIVPVMVQAIKELKAELDTLKNK